MLMGLPFTSSKSLFCPSHLDFTYSNTMTVPKISHRECICTMEIGRCYKEKILYLLERSSACYYTCHMHIYINVYIFKCIYIYVYMCIVCAYACVCSHQGILNKKRWSVFIKFSLNILPHVTLWNIHRFPCIHPIIIVRNENFKVGWNLLFLKEKSDHHFTHLSHEK